MSYENDAEKIQERDRDNKETCNKLEARKIALVVSLILGAVLVLGGLVFALVSLVPESIELLKVIAFLVFVMIVGVTLLSLWSHTEKKKDIFFKYLDNHDFDMAWLNGMYAHSAENTHTFLEEDRATFWRVTNPYDPDFELKRVQALTKRVHADGILKEMKYWKGWQGAKRFYIHPNPSNVAPVYGPCLMLRILHDILNDESVQHVGIKNLIPVWCYTSDREFGLELWVRWNDDTQIMFLVKVTHMANEMSVSVGHYILWIQPELKHHPRTPAAVMLLARDYQNIVKHGTTQLNSAHTMHRYGHDSGLVMSSTGSFYHFTIHDKVMGQGSQIGVFVSRLEMIVSRCCTLTCTGDDGWEDLSFQVEAPDGWH